MKMCKYLTKMYWYESILLRHQYIFCESPILVPDKSDLPIPEFQLCDIPRHNMFQKNHPEEVPESTAAETSEEAPEPVTPETCYEPSRNEMIALYGPPEMFRQMETAVPQADAPAQGPGEAAGTGVQK